MESFLSLLPTILTVANTTAIGILGLLHVKNSSAIGAVTTKVVDSVSTDAAALAHGQWEQALPGIIAQIAEIATTLSPGDIASVATPTGNKVVHLGKNGVVTALGMGGQSQSLTNSAVPASKSSPPVIFQPGQTTKPFRQAG